MIPVRGYKGQKVAVLGLGRSGLHAALALREGGAIPICWDDNEASQEKALSEGLIVADLHRDRAWEDVVSLIVSPGIPHLYPVPNPIIAKAWEKGVAVDNDIGLFFRSYATEAWNKFDVMPKIVAITGSNGKSTTTALTTHLLAEAGRPVQMGGNIGRGVLSLDPAGDGQVVVLELSSYQTDLARSLTPDIAVFMNLSPDHFDRHGGLGGYFAAKRRLFAEGSPDRAIIGVDENEGRYLANQMREDFETGEPVIELSVTRKLQGLGWSVYVHKGFLVEWRKGRQVASIDLRDIASLPGAHNHQNACAAYAVCRSLGLAPKQIEAGFKTYPGLPHRSQLVAEINGVKYVNDSKATNVDAAEQALKAFTKIRWIVGGRAKDGGIGALAPYFDKLEKAYLIGEAAEAFSKTLHNVPHEISVTIEKAIERASNEAQAGDIVLLSPACASFDQFSDFEKRGEAFIKAVEALQK